MHGFFLLRATSSVRAGALLVALLVATRAAAQLIPAPAASSASGFGPDHLPAVRDADDPLVDAASVVPGLIVQLHYATADNITGHPLYPANARCLLRKSIAEHLVQVAQSVAGHGMRLVAWDCTRPHSAQVELFRAHPHVGAVADPKRGSLHQRGVAIDLALADARGALVPLPTSFDAFGPTAAAAAPIPAGPAKENRDLLIAAMARAGFRPNPKEWWHFSRLWGFRWPEVPDEQLWSNPK